MRRNTLVRINTALQVKKKIMEKSLSDAVSGLSLVKTEVVERLPSTCSSSIRGTQWRIEVNDMDTFSTLRDSEDALLGCVNKALIETIAIVYPGEGKAYVFESSYKPVSGDLKLAEFNSPLVSDVKNRKRSKPRSRRPSS